MNKKTNLLATIVVLIMLVTSVSASASFAFSDIVGLEIEPMVERWHDANLISGYPDQTFKADELVTRAQFAKIICDLFVLEDTDAKFSDVSDDAWYSNYVLRASKYMDCCEKGESDECDNLFMPDQPIDMTDVVETLSLLTEVPDSVAVNAKGNTTRGELIQTIDEILGGETGFWYMVSVIDAHDAEVNEILPLVTIDDASDMVTTNDKGQVLLLSWHSYPDSYIPGQEFTCKYGEMWTFTDKEVLSWYGDNNDGITDWELRFKQLLGLPATDTKTHVSAFWVDPQEIIRPAFQPDTKEQVSADVLDGSALGKHKEWFDGNAGYSYETSAYPWTRLGYTYDWFVDDNEYGLTEFIILPDSVIDVEWTKSFDEFISWLNENEINE